MKKYFFIVILMILSTNVISQTTVEKIYLNTNWQFRQGGTEQWYTAEVPGTVHTNLYTNGLIPDPYFRDNEKELQWIENEDWEYRIEFDIEEKLFRKHIFNLVFEGLDTYAKVYLNDSLIIDADNMFREWEFECKSLLKSKGNVLKIIFLSPVRTADSTANNYFKREGITGLPGGSRVFTRKAAYQYGWDFAPRFVTSGIWKSVYIEAWDFFTFDNVKINLRKIENDKAFLTAKFEVNSTEKSDFLTHITDKGTGERLIYFSNQILPGKNIFDIDFIIPNPKLWWTNRLGEPYLYNLFIESTDNRERWNITEFRIGLRTIELIRNQDSYGESFYFKLNGVPVFIKGANFIPMDSFLPEIKEDRYKKIIKDVKESNMNMLRIWGGGIYEDDYFYKLCDSLGIMVWQDFMFACAMTPGDSLFLENIRHEAVDNLKRLQNHPCIALWCGNNEIDEGWNNWGWQKEFKYTKEQEVKIKNDYQKIFDEILPQAVKEFSVYHTMEGKSNYISSSPKIGWGHPEAMKEGDSHYWGVWWGMEPFELYEKKVPRFMSEFGFQAFPDMKNIESFTTREDRFLYSDALKSHQKHPVGYETIEKYMERDFIVPNDFQEYIKTSQFLQAYGIKKAIEAQRRAKPYCMGTLFWQLNDCWPGITWSAIDYYGKWKELQYKIKDLYADVLVSPTVEDDTLKVYVISDKLKELNCNLVMQIINSDSENTLWSNEIEIMIPGNSSEIFYQTSLNELLKNHDKNNVYLYCIVQDIKTHEWYSSNSLLFIPVKENTGYYKNLLMR